MTVAILIFYFFSARSQKHNITRAAVDAHHRKYPLFFKKKKHLYLGVKVTQNVAQYLLHNVTYVPVKFEVDMSNG